jgi:hypothetical protein
VAGVPEELVVALSVTIGLLVVAEVGYRMEPRDVRRRRRRPPQSHRHRQLIMLGLLSLLLGFSFSMAVERAACAATWW